MLRGEYSLKISGKDRHFKMCTLSDNLFCQYEDIKLSQYIDRIENPVAFTQLNLIYSQAVAYARIHKQPIDFSIDDVSVWLDEVGEATFTAEIYKIAELMKSKNQKAPEAGQSGSGTNV